MADISERLARLRMDYLNRLPGELTTVAQLAGQLQPGATNQAALKELHFRLHSLVGSSGTFGLSVLSQEARRLEHLAKGWLAEASLSDDDIARITAATAALPQLTELTAPAETAATKIEPPPEPPAELLPIWLVEPDTQLATEVQRQLQSFGYSVRAFANLTKARAATSHGLPDVLLLNLPPARGDTTEFDARLHRGINARNRPVLVIADHDDFASRARAVRIGAHDFFPKPLEISRLINRMAQLITQRRAPKMRVLIIEDDLTLAEHYRLALLSGGIEANILHNPHELISQLAAFDPDLVLMDLYMPDLSGPELAGIIRQHERWTSLPVVYLSAETDLDRQIEALRHGADDFITKPIADASLIALVRARIERGRQIDALVTRDSLTGLLRHATIKEATHAEIKRAARTQHPVSVAILDIDHFKQVNDRHGHATGDVVITATANLLRQRLRQSDLIGRYGGEEFVVVLVDCDASDAEKLLEDIRQRFASIRFGRAGSEFSCTLSAGLASLSVCGNDLLPAADAALYHAKNTGRNRVCQATPADVPLTGTAP